MFANVSYLHSLYSPLSMSSWLHSEHFDYADEEKRNKHDI